MHHDIKMIKLHLGKRWVTVCNLWRMQSPHTYESRAMFSLLNRSLVLSQSLRSSQKNTLCFIWHFDLHIHRKAGWTSLCPMRALYAFDAEKLWLPHMYCHWSLSVEGWLLSNISSSSWNCWCAWVERGKWKFWIKFGWFAIVLYEMNLFLAKEKSSGNATEGTMLFQRSVQKRTVEPSAITAEASPLKESRSLIMSFHQKDPFLNYPSSLQLE